MGTRVAPTYATLTMAFLEETKLYPKIQNALGERAEKYTRENWFRFLDVSSLDVSSSGIFSWGQLNN